jgi:hypothetical protein
VSIVDNDIIGDVTNPVLVDSKCKQTSFFMWSDTAEAANDKQTGVERSEWLIDYNCDNGDAGGLPGYPESAAANGDAGINGFVGVHGVDGGSGR